MLYLIPIQYVTSTDAWVRDNGTGKQYIVMEPTELTFTSVQGICNKISAILPEPRSQEENDFLLR